MKQKQKLIVLFISNLSSINFAWHFLNYATLVSFEESFLESEERTLKIEKLQKNKQYKELNAIVCLQALSEKQCNEIAIEISPKTQVITSNISCYLMFKQKKVNVVYVKIKEDISTPTPKLSLICTEEIEQEIFQETVSQKIDKKIINLELSKTIIYACVGGLSCLSKNNIKSLLFNIPKQTKLIKLFSESIRLTNSVMLTVSKFENFNFYKFLSGKGILKNIKQHFQVFALLYSLRNQTYTVEAAKESVNNLISFNYNQFCEINNIEQLLSNLTKL